MTTLRVHCSGDGSPSEPNSICIFQSRVWFVCVSAFVFVFVFSFEGLVCVWFAERQVTGLLSRGRLAGTGEDK